MVTIFLKFTTARWCGSPATTSLGRLCTGTARVYGSSPTTVILNIKWTLRFTTARWCGPATARFFTGTAQVYKIYPIMISTTRDPGFTMARLCGGALTAMTMKFFTGTAQVYGSSPTTVMMTRALRFTTARLCGGALTAMTMKFFTGTAQYTAAHRQQL